METVCRYPPPPPPPPALLSARILAADSCREIQFLLTAQCCPDRIYHPQPGARQTCTHSQLHPLPRGLTHTLFIDEQRVHLTHTHTHSYCRSESLQTLYGIMLNTQFSLIMQHWRNCDHSFETILYFMILNYIFLHENVICTFTSGIIGSCRFSWLLRFSAAPVDDTDV